MNGRPLQPTSQPANHQSRRAIEPIIAKRHTQLSFEAKWFQAINTYYHRVVRIYAFVTFNKKKYLEPVDFQEKTRAGFVYKNPFSEGFFYI